MATRAEELAEAQEDLVIWKAALRACATGKSYQIGTRRLDRNSVQECKQMVDFYKSEVARLSKNRPSGPRTVYGVPRG